MVKIKKYYEGMNNGEKHGTYAYSREQAKLILDIRLKAMFGKSNLTDLKEVNKMRGGAMAARLAHNQKVAGSNPVPARDRWSAQYGQIIGADENLCDECASKRKGFEQPATILTRINKERKNHE